MLFERELGEAPLVVSFPHSGTDLPDDVAARLSETGRSLIDTDWYVDRLYAFVRELGATTLRANVSRYVVDLNRDPSGVSLYPGQRTTGVCPVETFEGEALYEAGLEPGAPEIAARVEKYWTPYHRELEALVDRALARHGYTVLLDGHSIWGQLPLLFDGDLPDINMGTNSGASCATALTNAAEASLSGSSYSHVTNGRFKGGYITRHYGVPARGVHAVQIELNQSTYLADRSRTAWDNRKAAMLSRTLANICTALLAWRPAESDLRRAIP
jgi:N-formylglutamate amidohydrolase